MENSHFETTFDNGTSQSEIGGIVALEPIYKLFPKATILESNHGSLVLRKALAHGLPAKVFKSLRITIYKHYGV